MLAPIGRLLHRKAAEGHVRGRGFHQLEVTGQEVGRVGQHVAVQEQQLLGARIARQPVSALGAAFISRELDQTGRQLQGLYGLAHLAGQFVVAGAVVEQHQLDLAFQGLGFGVQCGDQLARIVVEERDQHRERRAGLRPRGVVEDPLLDRDVHAAAPCRARTIWSRRERRPAASSAKALRP